MYEVWIIKENEKLKLVFLHMIWKKKDELLQVLKFTDEDLEHYNHLSDEYKQLVLRELIKKSPL